MRAYVGGYTLYNLQIVKPPDPHLRRQVNIRDGAAAVGGVSKLGFKVFFGYPYRYKKEITLFSNSTEVQVGANGL